MSEEHQGHTRGQPLASRRGMMLSNIRAIAVLAAGAVAANLAKAAPAQARGDDRGDHRGDHRGDGHDRSGGGAPCFLRGTKIQTMEGERCVEDLAIGDLLPTAFGGTRHILWLGRWQFRKSDPGTPWKKHARPVRIVRSALAPEVPHTDLYVTQGHALFIDGVLISAGNLINGTSITLYDADEFDELEYFHVKVATHTVIYAEGAPCETLLKVPETARNLPEYVRSNEASATPDAHCAPILCNGARNEIASRAYSVIAPWLGPQKIDLIRARLDERAMALG